MAVKCNGKMQTTSRPRKAAPKMAKKTFTPQTKTRITRSAKRK